MFKPGSIVIVTDSSWCAVVNKQTGAITRGELHGREFKLLGVLSVPLPTAQLRIGTPPDRPNNSILVSEDGEVVFTHSDYLQLSDSEW